MREGVILIPFPFTDLSTFKQRPAIVKIVTLDRRLVRKKLGALPAETLAKITHQIQQIIEPSS